MDLTKEGLEPVAVAAGDDLARGIATKMGPAGAVLGVVPAISNDIEAGMPPAEAVVTEGAGAALGYRLGLVGGTATAKLVGDHTDPITGAVVGGLVGAGVSAGAALGTSRIFQSIWESLDGE